MTAAFDPDCADAPEADAPLEGAPVGSVDGATTAEAPWGVIAVMNTAHPSPTSTRMSAAPTPTRTRARRASGVGAELMRATLRALGRREHGPSRNGGIRRRSASGEEGRRVGPIRGGPAAPAHKIQDDGATATRNG